MDDHPQTRNFRNEVFDFVFHNMLADLITAVDDDHEDDILEEGLLQLTNIQTTRYLVDRVHIPKNFSLICNLLPSYDEIRFRRTLRMSRIQFYRIANYIRNHEEFEYSYYPVEVQLAIVFNRFGTDGNSSSVMAIARNFGVGDGGTVTIFTKRVINAILSLEQNFLAWPTTDERNQISTVMSSKLLPGCIGFVDGTHIGLNTAPRDDAISYFNRKSFYSLNVQIICDPFKKILSYHVGQPGKVHDAKVYSLMNMSSEPQNYFDRDQYIIGDAAYRLTSTVITPFRKNSSYTARQEKFNNHISKNRIVVEHVNGILKSRFASLRNLRMVVNRRRGHQYACEWVVACLILYNILLTADPWSEEDIEEDREENSNESEISNLEYEDDGQIRRTELLEHILNLSG